ncbi:hypothetical protein GX51_02717 [Blastomyces parvus]|uniref:Secreted protein n=1 Tax=Blastomyces parvus TaxID=2060905 RepID=A0A2B7X9H4_9EURO|nr:hypothetical protein GX51_02717 [Blastomyces parvus]
MKISTGLLFAIGFVGQMTDVAAQGSREGGELICRGHIHYPPEAGGPFINPMKPKPLTEVTREFCAKHRGTKLSMGQRREQTVAFEDPKGGTREVIFRFMRLGNVKEPPAKWDYETCLYLGNLLIDCHKYQKGTDNSTHFEGGNAKTYRWDIDGWEMDINVL